MKRIDKIISEQTHYTRKEIKKLVSQGKILVNDEIVKKSETKYDENNICIKINGEEIEIKKYVYLLLNKPKGYISSTEKSSGSTVLDLVPEKYKNRNLFPAGRLDKDTTGLMLITDDGQFAHNILSPRKHIKKIYEVTIDISTTNEMVECFKNGIDLNDGKCKSAIMEITGKYTANVTLIEGRYHQIKRMFGCYGAKVVELHRVAMGNLRLPEDLEEGQCRELTDEELKLLQQQL